MVFLWLLLLSSFFFFCWTAESSSYLPKVLVIYNYKRFERSFFLKNLFEKYGITRAKDKSIIKSKHKYKRR